MLYVISLEVTMAFIMATPVYTSPVHRNLVKPVHSTRVVPFGEINDFRSTPSQMQVHFAHLIWLLGALGGANLSKQ